MSKSKSFHDFCDLSRELISVTGREGILWTYLLDDLKLPTPQLQALIFRSLHQQYAYQFFNHQKQEIHSFQSLTEAEAKKVNGIRVYAPLSEIYRILGISSQIEIPPDPGMLILENIAKSKEKGLLMNEIGKLTDKKSAIYPIIDKLVTLGLIQKRMVTPIRHVSNSRGKARVVITHLVRYAHLYDPHKDQMEFEIGEAECEQVQQTIIKLLSQRGVISIPVFLIAPHFQLIAKHMTRRISTCITQLKSKCRLTLTTEKFRGKGPFTFVCCPSLGQEVEEDEDGGGNEDEDDGSSLSPSNTIFNMTVYEQVTYRLNMSNGLTSRKIKQLTGLRKKRCYLIVSTLIKTLKYRHETVQSGRQKLYSIFGKNPFQYTAPPPLALSGTPVSPTVPSLPNTSASLQITDLTQGTQVREETRREKESVEGPSKQVDLYSVRKNVITSCLEKTGGIIDNYTLTKETERCYKELNLSTQVDRKTVKRLMMKSVEEGGYEYVANVEHPEVRSFWMKPHLIYQNDLPNIQELLMKYVRKLHAWFIAGKNGRFLDYFHTLSGDPVNPSATAVAEAEQVDPQNPKDGDRVNEEEENSRLEMCQELESQIRTELHLENLLSYREENPHELLDESEGNTKTPVTLDRINSMISLCPHFISSSLSNPLDEVTLKEDNDRFFENLRLIHFQFLRMSQDCVTNRQRSFTCRFIDTLLKMKVKPFISIFGLCDEYLLDINQRIHRVNTRKKYSPSSYDQIFLKGIQQSLPMSALVFSQCPMASAFARVMLSRAVELHKLYVLSLLSLGLIQRSPFPNEIMTAKTIEEFEKTLLLSMGLQIATKPPGTTKLMKKITQYNQYWDETVAPVIAEPLRLEQLTCSGLRLGPSVSSIPVMVNNFFNLNMHLGCHSLEEFPSVALLSEQLANLSAAATATPKKRATKRKGTSDAVSSSPGGDFEKGTQHQMTPEELIAEEENVEVIEFEELNRPNKRFRKEEPIEVLADQEASALCGALIAFLDRPAVMLPQFLTNPNSFSAVASAALPGDSPDLDLPWFHPYHSLLGTRSSEADLSQQILSLNLPTSGGRRLTRKLPVILAHHRSLRKILSRVLKSLPVSSFDTPVKLETNSDSLEATADADGSAQEVSALVATRPPLVSEIINQLLDDTSRIHQTELRSFSIDEAAMNRALQIYFSHSEFHPPHPAHPPATEDHAPEAEEKTSQAETQFLEEIGSLKEYALPSVLRIHRELCGKRIITRHVAGGKRKSTGSTRVRGYDIREKVFNNLNSGIGAGYQHLLGDFSNELPLFSDPRNLSDDPHVDTSKGDFLCLLHRIAANDGREDFGRFMIRNAPGEGEEAVAVVREIGEAAVEDDWGDQQELGQGDMDKDRRRGKKVKSSYSALSGLFSLKLDRVHFEITAPAQLSSSANRSLPLPTPVSVSMPGEGPFGSLAESPSSVSEATAHRVLEYLETDPNGRTLADLISHFRDLLPDQSELREELMMLCSSQQVYRYPHYNSRYEETVFFLHYSHAHFYFGHLPQTLPHLFTFPSPCPQGEDTGGRTRELEEIPLSQQELLCPWVTLDGSRNHTLISLLVTKVMTVLTMRPQTQIAAIHSELPMLSCAHVAILLKKLLSDGFLCRHGFASSLKLQSPFHPRGPLDGSPSSSRSSSSSSSLTNCSFSLSPQLWEMK